MRILKFAAILSVSIFFAGCMGPTPLQGLFFADVKYPGYYEGVSEQGPGSKNGTATMTSYLGVYAAGDAGIRAACDAAGITNIKTVDHHYTSIMGFIQTWTTEVTGE